MNYLLRFILIPLITTLTFQTIVAQPNHKNPSGFVSQMDKQIPKWLDEFIVPGAALVVIDDGEVILKKGYGYADVKNKQIVDISTGFNIGSISKTVAAWGVLNLVEEGKISLDDPAEKYLTRWQLPDTEFDNSGVTIRRMLSHTAGLSLHGYPGWSPDDELPSIEESLSGKNNGPGDVRLIMEPGTKWKYSGGGFTILQLIIEEVTGLKFDEYMQTEILNPLGMNSSSYDISSDVLSTSSKEHNSYGEEIPFELFTAEAAAGLHTTIGDFTKFAWASLHTTANHTQDILSDATLEEMTTAAPASNGSYRLNRETGDGFAMVTNGGSGWNVYRQAYCEWVHWKYGENLGDRCKKAITPLLIRAIKNEGAVAMTRAYHDAKLNHQSDYYFNEGALNNLGYELLFGGDIEGAIAVFKLNTEEYPDSYNVYDSLGEAYMVKGDKEKAISLYEKSIEMNPDNQNGKDMLKKLKE